MSCRRQAYATGFAGDGSSSNQVYLPITYVLGFSQQPNIGELERIANINKFPPVYPPSFTGTEILSLIPQDPVAMTMQALASHDNYFPVLAFYQAPKDVFEQHSAFRKIQPVDRVKIRDREDLVSRSVRTLMESSERMGALEALPLGEIDPNIVKEYMQKRA